MKTKRVLTVSQCTILVVPLVDARALLAPMGKLTLALLYDAQIALLHRCREPILLMAIVGKV